MERFDHIVRTLRDIASGLVAPEMLTFESLESLRVFAEGCSRAAARIEDAEAAEVFDTAAGRLATEQGRRQDRDA